MHEENLVQDPFQIRVHYRFDFTNGQTVSFPVVVNLMHPEAESGESPPAPWARLENHQCSHCPLQSAEFPECPAASAIRDIVDYFSKNPTCNMQTCTVQFPGKSITTGKAFQECLSSLIGLRLATSRCPTLSEFRLLARFHEPFSTPYETVFRTASLYLLKQFFKARRGQEADWNMTRLKDFYEIIGRINVKMAERLKEAGAEDCGSLHVLSVFSVTMTWLFEDHLAILEKLVAD